MGDHRENVLVRNDVLVVLDCTAGNVLDLLIYLQCGLRNCDFSYLALVV